MNYNCHLLLLKKRKKLSKNIVGIGSLIPVLI